MTQPTADHLGFMIRYSAIKEGIFIPKYYNPEIENTLTLLSDTHYLIPISKLIADKHVKIATGHEIGKMAYGTGEIPFVRTSDISNWEIKTDPKQGVSQAVYEQYASRQDVQDGDIFFVRDGTYLIGQSCFITSHDLPCLYQSHILKVRINNEALISKELFFACLNAPIVKRQIRAKQFTADIIDTIGSRFSELILPVPKDPEIARAISEAVRRNIDERSRLREYIRKIPFWTQGLIDSMDDPLPSDFLQRIEFD